MIYVEFLGPIGKRAIEVEVGSLADLAKILERDQEVAKWLGGCAVSINGKITADKNALLKDGDKVALLPPVCGG